MDEQTELLELVPLPLQPPRASVPGEVIYLKLWTEYLAADPERLDRILVDTRHHPDQRAASIAASFMVFMGCNGGEAFTYTAEQYATHAIFHGRARAFAAAWANQNERRFCVNHGLRTVEYMLAREHPIDHSTWRHSIVESLVPELTMADLDVVEAMVEWWSTADAAQLRFIAQPLISAEKQTILSRMFPTAAASMADPIQSKGTES